MQSRKFKYLILLFFLFSITFVYAEDLHSQETTTLDGKTLLVKKIGEESVIFQVGNETKIINIGETKELAGIKITVSEIFFVEEKENRHVIFYASLMYRCGDGKCDSYEDQQTCCIDCGCPLSYECEDNRCEKPPEPGECKIDQDCNDNNFTTIDRCTGTPKKCIHFVECIIDQDCDDKNPCTEDKCITCKENCNAEKQCSNTETPNCATQTKEPTQEEPEQSAQTTEKSSLFARILRFFLNLFK